MSVVWHDSLVYNREFGSNSSTQNLYYIGSTSKTFTAFAIAQLRDSGKLNFDDPLLGNLTIREMFYLMTYHATHHLRQIINNLEQQTK